MAKAKRMDYYTKLRLQAFGIIGVGVVAIGGLVAYAIYEDSQWQAFAASNDCKLIAHKAGDVGYGMTANGKMGMIVMSDQNTYRCADGVDYTR